MVLTFGVISQWTSSSKSFISLKDGKAGGVSMITSPSVCWLDLSTSSSLSQKNGDSTGSPFSFSIDLSLSITNGFWTSSVMDLPFPSTNFVGGGVSEGGYCGTCTLFFVGKEGLIRFDPEIFLLHPEDLFDPFPLFLFWLSVAGASVTVLGVSWNPQTFSPLDRVFSPVWMIKMPHAKISYRSDNNYGCWPSQFSFSRTIILIKTNTFVLFSKTKQWRSDAKQSFWHPYH